MAQVLADTLSRAAETWLGQIEAKMRVAFTCSRSGVSSMSTEWLTRFPGFKDLFGRATFFEGHQTPLSGKSR